MTKFTCKWKEETKSKEANTFSLLKTSQMFENKIK